MVGELEPLYLGGVFAVSPHDSIPSWLGLVELESWVAKSDAFWLELHGQVVEHHKLLGNGNVMNHDWTADWDVQGVNEFVVLVEEGVLEVGAILTEQIVAEGDQLSSLLVYFGVCRYVVLELTLKVSVTDTIDIEIFMLIFDLNFKR